MSVCLLVYLVLLVLSGVGEARNDSCDADGRGDLAGVDHDEQLHQHIIYLAAPSLDNVHILSSHWLSYLNTDDKNHMKLWNICEIQKSQLLILNTQQNRLKVDTTTSTNK